MTTSRLEELERYKAEIEKILESTRAECWMCKSVRSLVCPCCLLCTACARGTVPLEKPNAKER